MQEEPSFVPWCTPWRFTSISPQKPEIGLVPVCVQLQRDDTVMFRPLLPERGTGYCKAEYCVFCKTGRRSDELQLGVRVGHTLFDTTIGPKVSTVCPSSCYARTGILALLRNNMMSLQHLQLFHLLSKQSTSIWNHRFFVIMEYLSYEFADSSLTFAQDNDDDIGALGSILSWDDDEQGNDAVNGNVAAMSAALRDRDFGSSTSGSAPPDTVQFFVGSNFQSSNGDGNVRSSNQDANLTLQLPLPTPISNFSQRELNTNSSSISANAGTSQRSANNCRQEQVSQIGNQSTHNLLAANFAQLLAQQAQAGGLIPQSSNQMPLHSNQPLAMQQSQSQQQKQQQSTDSQASQQQQQQQQANMLSSLLMQSSQQQAQQMPLMYTTDPSAFLQQLQFAQMQSMQAAQQQPQLQMQSQHQQGTQSQQQQQQQVQQQLQQLINIQEKQVHQQPRSIPQVTIAAGPAPKATRPPAVPQGKMKSQPPQKKQKTVKSIQSPTHSSISTAVPTGIVASGIVSASDTDGELSRKKVSLKLENILDDTGDLSDGQDDSVGDKAKTNRDRNREHARNTRRRKKAYLEKLQTTVDDLCRERDTLMSERTGAANLLVEMHNTRTEVLMSFFSLRSTNEKRRSLWESILDESCFACVMPVTPYRSFPASEVQVSRCQRTILGIDAIMADTASLHVLFTSLVDRRRFPTAKISFRYTLVTEEAVVAGNQMMARWVMSTTNAVQYGARTEVAKQGMLCCKFNNAHKITGFELMFDVMAFMLQLKQAAGSDGFSVIPNTVQTCQRAFDKPMVMTLAEPPYTIMQVNQKWEEMTGYSAEEVVGKKSCSILQNSDSSTNQLRDMMDEIRYKRPTAAYLINSRKSGELFRHFVLLFPLSTDSRITHYLALSSYVDAKAQSATEISSTGGTTAAQNVATAPSFPEETRALGVTREQDINGNNGFAAQPFLRSASFQGPSSNSAAVVTGERGQITLPSSLHGTQGGTSSSQMPPPSGRGVLQSKDSTRI
ncbi:hypothetical protein FisN_15Hh315 [Fistulifera solaris]|uniref:BZIP domain-containing protein n=1 Tax=Fistulifera solaris TaxID=1519565 RepID=A0A1Z5JFQ4_FISSO|nr:hypothetical protein FisN_15Hh315 [Fistulifera solaris]|eukprot:GAX12834.1 hypothetical protein FisN_15Hh315 [Fistulifera solaris]